MITLYSQTLYLLNGSILIHAKNGEDAVVVHGTLDFPALILQSRHREPGLAFGRKQEYVTASIAETYRPAEDKNLVTLHNDTTRAVRRWRQHIKGPAALPQWLAHV